MRLIAALAFALALTPAQAQTPDVVNVTYVASPFNVPAIVMREKGFLDEAFAEKGIEVVSHEITSGAQQVQALAAGAIDIATVLGGTSAILGRANGIDLKVIAAFSRSPGAYFIMRMEGGPASIAELRGKSIAGPKGTTLHQLLAAALASEGMTLDDVEHLSMDLPAARQALISGQVDAATLAGNNALVVEQAGGEVIASGEGLTDPTSVIAVRGEFLSEHPDLVETYLAAHDRALAFMAENEDEALKIAATEQDISIEDARRMMDWYDFTPAMTEDDVAHLEADQDFMVEADMLETPIDLRAELFAPIAFER